RAPCPGIGIHLGRELVDDDVDEAFQLGTFHRVRCSRSRIFASRRIYRGSCIDAPSQAATILVASSALTRVAPSVKMFAPLCSRAYLAMVSDTAAAARMPSILFAAIADPMPAPSMTIPASTSWWTTASATEAATSG